MKETKWLDTRMGYWYVERPQAWLCVDVWSGAPSGTADLDGDPGHPLASNPDVPGRLPGGLPAAPESRPCPGFGRRFLGLSGPDRRRAGQASLRTHCCYQRAALSRTAGRGVGGGLPGAKGLSPGDFPSLRSRFGLYHRRGERAAGRTGPPACQARASGHQQLSLSPRRNRFNAVLSRRAVHFRSRARSWLSHRPMVE